jgi:hypothetical protein
MPSILKAKEIQVGAILEKNDLIAMGLTYDKKFANYEQWSYPTEDVWILWNPAMGKIMSKWNGGY